MQEDVRALESLDAQALHLEAKRRGRRMAVCRWEMAACLLAVERTKAHLEHGCSSVVQYATRFLDLESQAAYELLRVARALAALPELSKGFCDGDIPWTSVRELTRNARPEDDTRLAQMGRRLSTAEIERVTVRSPRAWEREKAGAASAAQDVMRATFEPAAADVHSTSVVPGMVRRADSSVQACDDAIVASCELPAAQAETSNLRREQPAVQRPSEAGLTARASVAVDFADQSSSAADSSAAPLADPSAAPLAASSAAPLTGSSAAPLAGPSTALPASSSTALPAGSSTTLPASSSAAQLTGSSAAPLAGSSAAPLASSLAEALNPKLGPLGFTGATASVKPRIKLEFRVTPEEYEAYRQLTQVVRAKCRGLRTKEEVFGEICRRAVDGGNPSRKRPVRTVVVVHYDRVVGKAWMETERGVVEVPAATAESAMNDGHVVVAPESAMNDADLVVVAPENDASEPADDGRVAAATAESAMNDRDLVVAPENGARESPADDGRVAAATAESAMNDGQARHGTARTCNVPEQPADRAISPKKRRRQKVTGATLDALYARSNGRCEHCGQRGFLHVHHTTPWCHGGENVLENLMLICSACHALVHRKDFETNKEWAAVRARALARTRSSSPQAEQSPGRGP